MKYSTITFTISNVVFVSFFAISILVLICHTNIACWS